MEADAPSHLQDPGNAARSTLPRAATRSWQALSRVALTLIMARMRMVQPARPVLRGSGINVVLQKHPVVAPREISTS